MNKSFTETIKIASNKIYIKITKDRKKESYLTGGDAINAFLENMKLEKT
jgi:hypothetical protein